MIIKFAVLTALAAVTTLYLTTAALGLGFNRSMQHIKLCVSRRSVAHEAKTKNILFRRSEDRYVGALEAGRVPAPDCAAV